MKFIFTLALFASQSLALLPQGRIVGGYQVLPSFKYPWIASLQYYNSHSCGGTWYSGRAIITAAHCVIGLTSRWTAHVHRHNLDLKPEQENGNAYQVISRISHPEYNSKNDESYDISIWKVNANFTRPSISLDTGKIASSADTILTVIGWGDTRNGGSGSSTLLEVKLPVYDIKKFKNVYSKLDTTSKYCAGYPEGSKDSCQGDSGGPMFVSNGSGFILVGVVSWGKGCALKGFPGVYTQVSAVSGFISENI